MLGAGLGIALAPLLPGASPSLWALVCMSAVLGSALGAPLTAIVFAIGLTHDSEALLPLLLTTIVAYGSTVLTMKRSIMTEKIARRGLHIYREYGVDPLERQYVNDLMTREPVCIDGDLSVAAALETHFHPHSPHRGYPVVRDERLLGMLHKHDLQYAPTTAMRCADLLQPLQAEQVLLAGDIARTAAGRMAELGVSRLPVVADINSMRTIGILSLRDLLKPSHLALHEETVKERLL
jgi:CBS domain-containing protein